MVDIPNSINQHLLTNETVLRQKQKEAVANAMGKIVSQGKRAVAMIMPTATGKMVIIARMLAGIFADNTWKQDKKNVLFVCDGVEGIKQARDKIRRFAQIEAGAYYQYMKDWKQQVTVTTFHSWQSGRFPVDPDSIDLVILDEAHMAITEARLSTLRFFKHAIWIAVTASPYYSDEQDVLRHFELGYQLNMREAVQNRLICGFRNILLRSDITIDVDAFQLSNDGEYNEKMLAAALNTEARNRIGAEFILFANHIDTGKPIREHRGIISCVDIAHANDVANQLNALYESYYPGQAPEHGFVRSINGFSRDRDQLLQWHQNGKIQYLSFADLLIHNYDDPGISICLNLRLSKSIVLSTQRGGRATRLDPNNPGKIALIVDLLDIYNGENPDAPAFYASAIGEVAVIPEDVAQMARENLLVFQPGWEVGRLRSIPIELRQMAKNAEFRIITDQEIILTIIRENAKEKAKAKTEEDLILSDVYRLAGVSKHTASTALSKLKTDWERYKAEPGRISKPVVDLYYVWQKGKGEAAAISQTQWEIFIDYYLNGRDCPFKTDSDLGPHELSQMTGLGESTIRKLLFDLQAAREASSNNKSKKNSDIPLKLVRRKGSSPFLSIKRDDFTKFVSNHLKERIFPRKSPDQIGIKELAQLTGQSAPSVRMNLSKIWKQWQAYNKGTHGVVKPLIIVTKVRDISSAPTYVILKEDLSHFLNIYTHGHIIQEKTTEDLIVQNLLNLTGYSRNTISDALLKLEKQWAVFYDTRKEQNKPLIPIYIVSLNKINYKAIPKSHFSKFLNFYFNGRTIRPISKDDMTAEEIAEKVGLRKLTISYIFRDIAASQQKSVGNKSVSESKVKVTIVKDDRSRHIPTISRKDEKKFIAIYLKGRVGSIKTENDLTSDQLSELTGYGISYIKNCLRELYNDWKQYNNNPDNEKRPLVWLNSVVNLEKPRSRQERSIRLEHLEVFRLSYLSKKVVSVKSEDDLTVSDISTLTGLAKQTVSLAFTRINADNKQYKDGYKPKPPTFIDIYDVKVPRGSEVQAIHSKDFRKFMEQNFSYMVTHSEKVNGRNGSSLTGFLRPRQDRDYYFTLIEMIKITGLSKYILMQYICLLEDAWEKYRLSPRTFEKPSVRLVEVVGKNQFKKYAIPQADFFDFLTLYVPKKRFIDKHLEQIYKEISLYNLKLNIQKH